MNEDERHLVVAVIEGSARDGRQSMKATEFVAEVGRTFESVDVVVIDPKNFTFPNDGNSTEGKDPAYTALVERADAFFIVTPEYNHSIPGSLKRMLDSEYDVYHNKPVALAGVSNGDWGGTRVVEALLPAVRSLGLLPLRLTTYFPRVQDIFDEQGILDAQRDRYTKSVASQWRELIWIGRSIKWGRTHFMDQP